eukprot:snap_masked-scaffold_1-processed-gene-32.25-mRNA-1 protein AED:1.00 eAED:1.00 QI:0/-1/0/0/-1/1/1/0/123
MQKEVFEVDRNLGDPGLTTSEIVICDGSAAVVKAAAGLRANHVRCVKYFETILGSASKSLSGEKLLQFKVNLEKTLFYCFDSVKSVETHLRILMHNHRKEYKQHCARSLLKRKERHTEPPAVF